ncbi:conserved hypothetical protein [Phenylobacterium zucineum HLK1]|uniref:YspA cpYpsA-related SLOG domain-containing protein n=1 Tax=Phenylobacterium zucineum (strain HLK1) TaxID=450851 RepID=B4RFZ7_PHEZH|nr:DUF2493 domain-containing protein [Phenylobacterium zucineum]ACG78810.1 conserved hypothetical protein [Phenylobacterium zucineum HLK1]
MSITFTHAAPQQPDLSGGVDLDPAAPQPTRPALDQLGHSLMTEVLDLVLETALETHVRTICETFIGGLHAGVQRVERQADQARDALARQLREFDGSEVADTELQSSRQAVDAADAAVAALERVRDAAAATYASATGECWTPWRGSARASVLTAAQLDVRTALQAAERRRMADADPGEFVVAFRASPRATSPEDAGRIFDALNWARTQWPDMTLALTGADGGERLAARWAQQKRVRLVVARPDFDRHGRAAPFRANEALLALQPICALVLASPLDPQVAGKPFGPALNLAQLAGQRGVRCLRIRARAPRPSA